MQPWMLVMVVAVLVHQAATSASMSPWLDAPALWLAFVIPKIVLAIGWALACIHWRRQRAAGTAQTNWWRTYAKAAQSYRYCVVALLIGDLIIGVLIAMSQQLNEPVLVDEALILLGPLVMVAWGMAWGLWAERGSSQAVQPSAIGAVTVLADTDELLTDDPPPQPSRPAIAATVVGRMRDLCVPVLLPVGLLYGWWELAEKITWPLNLPFGLTGPTLTLVVQLVGVAALFAIIPALLCRAMSTTPLAAGEYRQRITAVLDAEATRVRDVLIWHTSYGKSAALALVLGVVKPWRYLIVTEGLLNELTPAQLEAVVAHEVAHLRERHAGWLLLAAIALLGGVDLLWQLALVVCTALAETVGQADAAHAVLQDGGSALVVESAFIAGLWFYLFGKARRQVERHADAVAVATIARIHATPETQNVDGVPIIQPEHGRSLAEALGQLAASNGVNPRRARWGYDSIATRQQKALALVSQPINALPIHRAIRLMKRASVGILLVLAAWQLMDW